MINVYLDKEDMDAVQQLTDDMIDYTVDRSSNMYYRTMWYNLFYVLLDVKRQYNITNGNIILLNGHIFKVRDGWINM